MKENHQILDLKEVERVEIVSLMDNTIDILSTSSRKEVKHFRDWVKKVHRYPIAEHGLSMLIRIYDEDKRSSILFDAGVSQHGVVMNARRMGINLAEVDCIVLSHGHYDHFKGLPAIVKTIGKKDLPIIVHRDMFKRRGVVDSSGVVREYPSFPSEDMVKPARFIETRDPHLLADGLALVSGEIPRRTSFEIGFQQYRVFTDGKWKPDPWIWDERALIINVRGKGLVILSGCSHAGIINTTFYAQQLTGVKIIYAILGGLHLAGKGFEDRINRTIDELRKINPRLIVPMHCTGWRANHAIFDAMPDASVWNSVGNLYIL